MIIMEDMWIIVAVLYIAGGVMSYVRVEDVFAVKLFVGVFWFPLFVGVLILLGWDWIASWYNRNY